MKILNVDAFSLNQTGLINDNELPDFVLSRMLCDNYLSNTILRLLGSKGISVFNSVESIQISTDKYWTHLTLDQANLPTLRTILCTNFERLKSNVAADFGYPLVIKTREGSGGNSIELIKDSRHFDQVMNSQNSRNFLIAQEFISESSNCDLRIIVAFGEVIGGMMRKSVNQHEFRSNLSLGGTGTKFVLDKKLTDLASQTAKELGLVFCGIDFLLSNRGPLICEVNSTPGFKIFDHVNDVSTAERFFQGLTDRKN